MGRTGTFIALDYLLEQAKIEGEMDVHGYACVMRSNRVNMIQTLVSTSFSYFEQKEIKVSNLVESMPVLLKQFNTGFQEQYIFVYDGLLEALMSGDTCIPCPDLLERYEELQQPDPETNKSKLQDQFDVST